MLGFLPGTGKKACCPVGPLWLSGKSYLCGHQRTVHKVRNGEESLAKQLKTHVWTGKEVSFLEQEVGISASLLGRPLRVSSDAGGAIRSLHPGGSH